MTATNSTRDFNFGTAANDRWLSDFLNEQVFPRLTAEQVFTHPAHRFHKNGVKMRGGCPWHASDSGTAFVVSLDTNSWYCAGCDFGGGVLQYLHRLDGGDGHLRGDEFITYAHRAAELAGVAFPERELTPEERERARAAEARRTILEVVNRLAVARLWSDDGQAARDYLMHARSFTDGALRVLGFGLYPRAGDLAEALHAHGIAQQDIVTSGVLRTGSGSLTGYVTIPWNDASRRPLTIYGRYPGDPPPGWPKTTALPGEGTKRAPLYFDRARAGRQSDLVLVEGVLDAAIAQANGDTRVVACVAAQLSRGQVETLRRHRVQAVTICLDPDGAGENGIASCITSLCAAGITPYVAPTLPDGLDPDEFIIARGINAWRAHIDQRVHGYRYTAARIIAGAGAGEWTDTHKTAVLTAATAFASAHGDHAAELHIFFWPEINEALGVDSAQSAYSAHRAAPDEWPDPLAFHEGDLPSFPVAALPAWLAEWVTAEAETTQTPPDLPALLGIGALSAAAAGKVRVTPQPGWDEPVNLFGVIVLPPGSRKSAVFADATAPIEDYEAELVSRARQEMDAAELKRRTLEAELQKLVKIAAGATGDERLIADADVQEVGARLAQLAVPELPRLIVDDCTPERLASLLGTQGGRIAVLSPEGDVFEIISGKYSSGVPNFGVFLKGHSGDSIRVDRVGRAPELIRQPALTLFLTIQPEVLQGLIGRPGFRGRGLLGRFLYALPENTVGSRKVRPAAMPARVSAAYDTRLRAILDLELGRSLDGTPMPYALHLSPAAERVFDAFVAELEPQISEFGALAHIADWAGKLAGAVARLAGLLHTAEHIRAGAAFPLMVEAATVEDAITIGGYTIAHARAAFAEMGADPVVEDAKYLLRWLLRGEPVEQITRRDLFTATRGRFKKVEDIDPALRLLIAHQYLREAAQPERDGPGRKPSPTFDVNPALYAQNAHFTQNPNCAHSAHSAHRDDDDEPTF